MPNKTVSQKRFAKGINATTGILSQQPGSLPRMSNLLLTQRGSLQVCDGSSVIGTLPSPFTDASVIDVFNQYASGQYPLYPVLANTAGAYIANPTYMFMSTGGNIGNNAGNYYFAIVARGAYGSLTLISGAYYTPVFVAAAAFSTVIFHWTPVPNATGYDIYYITSAGAT